MAPSDTAKTAARIVYAPERVDFTNKSVFLAGSIDMGQAVDWQASLQASLAHHPITILNPRRPAWNAGWTQDISFAPFKEQVDWELDMLEKADIIALYFGPDSQSPISLLELGLFAKSGKLVVSCPEGYWRRGNVQIVCDRWKVELVDSLDALKEGVERRLKKLE